MPGPFVSDSRREQQSLYRISPRLSGFRGRAMLYVVLVVLAGVIAVVPVTGCGGSTKSSAGMPSPRSSPATEPTGSPLETRAVKAASGKPLTRAALFARADAICAETNTRLAAVSTNSQQELARVLPQVAVYDTAESLALRKLVPPASFASQWERILADSQLYGEYVGRVAHYAEAHDFKSAGALIGAASEVQTQLIAAAGRAGLKQCSQSHADSQGTGAVVPATAPTRGYLKDDGDRDFDDKRGYRGDPANDDRALFAAYDGNADRVDAQAIASLVKRYLRAIAAGNVTRACAMLDTDVLLGLAGRSGQTTNESACATALAPLLRQQARRLAAADVRTAVVTSVHVKGNLGLAALGFKAAPEGELAVAREGRVWKVDALIDGEMT